MHPRSQKRPLLLLATRGLLLLAFAAATVTVARSQVGGDRPAGVTGIPFDATGNCVTRCNDTFIKQLQGEYTFHKNVVKNVCGGNFVCHKDENYRHQTSLQAIIATHKACKNLCTPQGTATGF